MPAAPRLETRLAPPLWGHLAQAKPVKGDTVDEDRVKGKSKEIEGEAQQKWGEGKDKARDVWEDVKDKAEDVVDRGEDRVDELDEETAPSSSR
jgi:uncharacterized protein YjbJ (UPF0337 family)